MENIELTITGVRTEKLAVTKELHESNMELKAQIASSKAELHRLTAQLRVIEQPFYTELERLDAKLSLTCKMRETIRDVTELKTKVHKCTDGSRLPYIFIQERFTTFYYNEVTSGYYINEGGERDTSCFKPNPPARAAGHVEFNCYAAFEISQSEWLSLDQKVEQLDELFDAYLR